MWGGVAITINVSPRVASPRSSYVTQFLFNAFLNNFSMLKITHLLHHPHLIEPVARMIYNEFWRDVGDGMSLDDLVMHLRGAKDVDRIPLCLIALHDEQLVGTVNLIENDDNKRAHLRPWLAAMVVREDKRGCGIGTTLVKALLAEARTMRIPSLYFGTDGPGFYERIGATRHEDVRPNFCIMKFEPA
jgi:N-acetylglutamate synthase-like GNAT family acetyltransferase